MLAGLRIQFAFPNTDVFAKVMAEKLPLSEYPQSKQVLIESLDYTVATTPSVKRNSTVASELSEFDARGLDRDTLEGQVIGTYLLFNDGKHIVTTIYLLNQDPSRRKFQTVDQYRSIRDRFLSTYTACIRKSFQ